MADRQRGCDTAIGPGGPGQAGRAGQDTTNWAVWVVGSLSAVNDSV